MTTDCQAVPDAEVEAERLNAIKEAVGNLEDLGVPFEVLVPMYEYLARMEEVPK